MRRIISDIGKLADFCDHETAVMAIQSALTGHLVFSTPPTNDAASAVTRMLDLEIEPYLLSSSLLAVLVQHLVRKVCKECARPVNASDRDRGFFAAVKSDGRSDTLMQGAGCGACRNTGYRGQIGIFDLLPMDDAVRDCIQERSNASQIRDTALEHGMRLLHDDGIRKVISGGKTIEEVSRVTVRATM